ncbi:MAG: hypothetical protein AAF211_21955 [Myxococcota bacterium]
MQDRVAVGVGHVETSGQVAEDLVEEPLVTAHEVLLGVEVADVVFHDGRLWGADDDAIYSTDDDGETWLPWRPLPDGPIRGLGTNRPR